MLVSMKCRTPPHHSAQIFPETEPSLLKPFSFHMGLQCQPPNFYLRGNWVQLGDILETTQPPATLPRPQLINQVIAAKGYERERLTGKVM